MAPREQADLTSDEWTPWITQVCAVLGIDPDHLDVPLIHNLTRQVAHRYARPMAPISAHLVGIALGRAMCADADLDVPGELARLVEVVTATLPAET